MKLIASGVANWAAIVRSPSFSRSAASTTTTNFPWRMSSIASSIVANGRPRLDLRAHLSLGSYPGASPTGSQTSAETSRTTRSPRYDLARDGADRLVQPRVALVLGHVRDRTRPRARPVRSSGRPRPVRWSRTVAPSSVSTTPWRSGSTSPRRFGARGSRPRKRPVTRPSHPPSAKQKQLVSAPKRGSR